jgi:hypothetical protein
MSRNSNVSVIRSSDSDDPRNRYAGSGMFLQNVATVLRIACSEK